MKPNQLHFILGVAMLLLGTLACASPGQTLQPAPVANPDLIQTAIAGTSQAAAQQTEQATVIPATATATATSIELSPTPVPEVVSSFGTSLVKREDGFTQFRDYRAGVQILFPTSWLLMRAGEPEYYEGWEKQGTQNQWFLEEIASIQYLDLNLFRVSAYDTHSEHIFNDNLPKINVVFLQGDTRTLKKVEADEKTLIKQSVKSGHKHLSSDFQVLAGLDVLLFQSEWDSVSYPKTHYKGTFFKVPAGLMIIDYYIASEQQDAMEPEWKQIVESITLFTP